jgi:diguanylate cyclase (GGDEF)-like protein
MNAFDMQSLEERCRQSAKVSDDNDIQAAEKLSSEAMMQLISELKSQNKQLQRSQMQLEEVLRTKEALLEKANAQLAENRQGLPEQEAHDPLTGLLKLRGALKVLSKELARNKRNGEELSIGLCDVDGFEGINDTYGRRAANEVLCWVAQTLTTSLREYDTVARIGGEKFLLIMPLQPGSDAEAVCERLCNQISNSKIATIRGELGTTSSIGVRYAAKDSTILVLRAEADAALCHAKKMGCNRTVYFAKA